MPLHVVLGLLLISLLLCAMLAGMVTVWLWALGRLFSGQPLLPATETEPRRVPWGAGSVIAVITTCMLVNVLVSSAYFWMRGIRQLGQEPSMADRMVAVSLINGMLLFVVPFLLRRTSGARLEDLGLFPRRLGRQALVGTMGFLLVSPVVYLVNWLALKIWEQNKHLLEKMVTDRPTAGIALLAFLSAVILAPAAEELLFRAILQGWLARLLRRPRNRVPVVLEVASQDGEDEARAFPAESGAEVTVPGAVTPVSMEGELTSGYWTAPALEDLEAPRAGGLGAQTWIASGGESPDDCRHPSRDDRAGLAAVALTSALFAAVHLPQWPAPIAIFFLSIGLGVVYQRTGSLFASFLMHALFNGFSTLVLFQAILVGKPADPKAAPTATSSAIAAPMPGARPLTPTESTAVSRINR